MLLLRSLRTSLVAACLLLPALCAASPQSAAVAPSDSASAARNVPGEKLRLAGVPNAGKISDVLLRGAQPSQQGFSQLKKLGVTTIVDLRSGGSEIAWERKATESVGLHFVNIPVLGWMPPSDEQVAQFLTLFHGTPGRRIFVHCRYGDDRTGVMVGAYRIAQQSWTAEQTVKEMYSFGFHYYVYRNMESYVRKFPAKFATDAIFAPLRGASAPALDPKQ